MVPFEWETHDEKNMINQYMVSYPIADAFVVVLPVKEQTMVSQEITEVSIHRQIAIEVTTNHLVCPQCGAMPGCL